MGELVPFIVCAWVIWYVWVSHCNCVRVGETVPAYMNVCMRESVRGRGK